MDSGILIKPKNTPPGTAPGYLNIAPDALESKLILYSYNTKGFREQIIENCTSLKEIDFSNGDIYWLQVKGLGSKETLELLASQFLIHKLYLEDIVNVYQRPKLEENEEDFFITSRMIQYRPGGTLKNEQLSLFLKNNFLISFQENYSDYLSPVIDRIKNNKGNIRQFGVDYLCYALLDTVVDNYFPALQKIGDNIDKLEIELLFRSTKNSLRQLLRLKRSLVNFRSTIWSERDKLNDILRTDSKLFATNAKRFLLDTYDHCKQCIDILENQRDLTSSMMDIYLSGLNQRTNQIMKVLAIISTIFIPLTFIVGVYGMNFSREDSTGKALPLNMPELYSPYGYISVMALMFVIVIFQLYFFYKKGWLSKN